MKAEELYEKEFGNADSIPKESVIRLLRHFAKALEMERTKFKNNGGLADVSSRSSVRRISGDGVFYRCSSCEYEPDMMGNNDLVDMNYCPNCGGKFE